MTLKKWLLILVPLAIIGALVGWRFSVKIAEEQQAGGGAPGAAASGGRGGGAAVAGGGGAPKGGGGGAPGGGGGPGGGGPPAVEVAKAEPRTITESIEAVGNAESPFRVQIAPKTTGRIEFLQVREGDEVLPGQVLVRIDTSELQAQVSQQEANVAEARSRLAQAQLNQGPTEVGVQSQIQQQRAGLTGAQAELTQTERNYDAQVAAADAAVADARSRVNSAEAQVRNAEAEVERQQASLRNAETRLARVQSLYNQGFLAAQELDDAKTATEVQSKAVEVAKGQLSAAKSGVASAESQLKSAQNQASITRRKGQADIATARSRVTQARASVNVASANRAQTPAYRQNLAALQSSVHAAQAQLAQARVRLSETSLRSSIAGVVTQRNADPGALASPGQPVLVVQSLDWLYITSSLPVEQSNLVTVGKNVQVKFDALPNQTFIGPVTHVNPSADAQSRKVNFRVKLANPGRVLKPGMFAKVFMPTSVVNAAVAVPREAVKTDEGKSTVTVIDSEKKAQTREVQVGASDEKYVQIVSGLNAGDQVVTLSYRPVRDGQTVSLGGAEGKAGAGRRAP